MIVSFFCCQKRKEKKMEHMKIHRKEKRTPLKRARNLSRREAKNENRKRRGK